MLTRGSQSTSEVAGLGPDAHLRYLKQQLDAGVNVVLAPGLTFNVAASGGVMLPWGEGWEGRPTCIADRCGAARRGGGHWPGRLRMQHWSIHAIHATVMTPCMLWLGRPRFLRARLVPRMRSRLRL